MVWKPGHTLTQGCMSVTELVDIKFPFLAHLDHVSYWYHFGVCRPYTCTFLTSHLKPLGLLGPNFGGMVFEWTLSELSGGWHFEDLLL